MLAEPVGGTKKIQAVGNVVVKDKPAAPAVGDSAPASKAPTLANATLKQLTTAKTPDRELYRTSVAGLLRAHKPVRRPFRHAGVLHEPHLRPGHRRRQHRPPVARRLRHPLHPCRDLRGQRPGERREPLGQGGSSSEPWVFLVGEDSRIKDQFQGTVSVRELDAAVDEHLVG